MSGIYINPSNNNFLNFSGGTVSGQTTFTGGLSATTFSAGTITSGGTDLYNIFLTTADGNDITRVQPGTNTYTGGSANAPTVNISAATLTYLSATTISGGTINSGSTNLYSIFQTIGNSVGTLVQPGLNTYTGGTSTVPTVNISAATLTYLSATTISGGTITSGATNLYDIFITQLDGNDITRVQPGTNTYTGGSANFPTINISAVTLNTLTVSGNTNLQAVTASTFIATTISGGTITSGGTDLYNIFLTTADGNDITRVQPGLNTYTGGTGNAPTINVSAATLTYLSATTISGGTITSGATNLYDIFLTVNDGNDITRVQPGLNTYTGGSANAPTINVSAATLNTLTASGSTNLQAVTATTISASTFIATTISGGTITSGGTDLYNIFITQLDGNDITRVQPGTNTYTGGTDNAPTINISAATLNTLFTSGDTILNSLTATTITSTTLSASSIYVNEGSVEIEIGEAASGVGALWLLSGAHTTTNPTIAADTTNTFIRNANSSGAIIFRVVNTTKATIENSLASFFVPLSAGTITASTINTSSISASTISGGTVTVNSIVAAGNIQAGATVFGNQGQFNSVQPFTSGAGIPLTIQTRTTSFGDIIFKSSGTTPNETMRLTSAGTMLVSGATILLDGFSSFTSSISGVSFLASSGGTPVLNINTVNGRVGINNPIGTNTLDVGGNINVRNSITTTLVGGYFIGGNQVIQQGPLGYSSNAMVFGNPSTAAANTVFAPVPFGIATSGNTLRNSFTLSQPTIGNGTVAATSGVTTVTGTGTSFLTFFNPGDTIRVSGVYYTISSIQTDTLLTLTQTAATTQSTTVYATSTTGERFTIGGNGNVRSSSNSISGFTVVNQTGGTPVFNVDTKNLKTSINGGLSITSGITANTFFNDTEQIYGNVIKSTPPLNTGNTWVRSTDSEVFIYDTIRTKWLSLGEERLTGAKASNSATTQFLSYEDGLFFSTTPFRLPYDSTITRIIMVGVSADTWQAFITTGSSMSTNFIATLGVSANVYSAKTDYNVNVLSGQTLYLGFSGTNVNQPRVDIYFKRRGQ